MQVGPDFIRSPFMFQRPHELGYEHSHPGSTLSSVRVRVRVNVKVRVRVRVRVTNI